MTLEVSVAKNPEDGERIRHEIHTLKNKKMFLMKNPNVLGMISIPHVHHTTPRSSNSSNSPSIAFQLFQLSSNSPATLFLLNLQLPKLPT